MEVASGIFVSNVNTNAWKPDPEVGGEMHVIVEVEGHYAGISRFASGDGLPDEWTLPERETILVLEGTCRIEFADGPTLDLKPGDSSRPAARRPTRWATR